MINNLRITGGEKEKGPLKLSLHSTIYMLLAVLGLWGCMAICNATFYNDSPFYFVGRQSLWLIIGLFVLFISARVPFEFYRRFAIPIAVAAYIPLLLVLVLETKINGMRGWFSLGCNVFMQPSEFAKIPFVLLLTHICAGRAHRDCGSFTHFMLLMLITLFWIIPLALEPDFGAIILFLAAFVIVYWVSGGKTAYLVGSMVALLPGCAVFLYINRYAIGRIIGFISPDTDPLGCGWHIRQFQYTLARGGLFGESWGKAIWANCYLPLPHSDSVFASLTESVGFAGAFPVIAGICVLAVISYLLATRAQEKFSRIFIFSAGMLFAVQALVHISVNVTLLPPTGITLPILSYGGSSLVSTMLAFGLILSASKSGDQNAGTLLKKPPQ